MTPCHFGSSDAPLLGVHYPPKGKRPEPAGVLLCYPGPEEYMRVHWVYRNLAAALVKAGFHVFKFDYYGTGDSAGPTGEGSVKRWTDDLVSAAQELKDMSGVKRLSLVGCRLGGALAATAPLADLDDLVLWDPVVTGTAYLAELRALETRRMANSRFSLERMLVPGEPELLGYPFQEAMEQSVERIDLMKQPWAKAKRTTLVQSEARREWEALAGRVSESVVVDEPCRWATHEVLEIAILPNRVVARIAELVARPL